jgi:Mannosyltransferase (PIG-V)
MLDLVPQDALASRFHTAPRFYRWRAWWDSPASFPYFTFVLSRSIFFLLTVGSAALLSPGHGNDRLAGTNSLTELMLWNRWDAHWYIAIAAHGYTDVLSSAFFPLFPALMRLFGEPFAGFAGNTAYLVSGIIIANTAFLVALVLFHRLIWQQWDAASAQLATLLLVCYPKTVFTAAPYGESIFLVLALGAYMVIHQGHLKAAIVLIFLATLDRQVGIALLIPLAWELWQRNRRDWRKWIRNGWYLLAAPGALVFYSIVLTISIGHPFGYLQAEALWKRHFTLPPLTILLGIYHAFRLPSGSVQEFNMLVDIGIICLWVGLLISASLPFWRRIWHIPVEFLALGWGLTLLPLSAPLTGYAPDLLSSQSRYLLAAFPLFGISAVILREHPRSQFIWLAISGILSILYAIAYIMGGYVI